MRVLFHLLLFFVGTCCCALASSSSSSSDQYAAAASAASLVPPEAVASNKPSPTIGTDGGGTLETSASSSPPVEPADENASAVSSRTTRPSPASIRRLSALLLSNPRFANLRERTLPAVLLLAGLYGLVQTLGERGLQYLVLIMTPGLYHEGVSVALKADDDSSTSTDKGEKDVVSTDASSKEVVATPTRDTHRLLHKSTDCYSNRWIWFVSYSFLSTVPIMFPNLLWLSPTTMHYLGYLGVLFGWVSWIVQLNHPRHSDAVHLRQAWREVTIYHMSVFFTVLPITCWLRLLRHGHEAAWALYAALLVIGNDTFAYLVGHFFGQTPLLPIISPKKTLEGFLGALALTLITSPLLWKSLFDTHQDVYSRHSLAVALFSATVAPLGGFVASTLKRASNQKDFGALIVGHGGLIDRLDCQLVTAPFVYLYLRAVLQQKP